MGVSARVDQLRIHMKTGAGPPDAALQNMRYPQLVTNPAHVSLAAVLNHTRPADHLEIGNFRKLGQNVILHAIGKGHVLFLVAQVFKWQHGDSRCYRIAD